jgi:hypothetical protein
MTAMGRKAAIKAADQMRAAATSWLPRGQGGTDGVDHRGDRLVPGEGLQPAGHRGGRHVGAGDEGSTKAIMDMP